jgi:hypothetical protein
VRGHDWDQVGNALYGQWNGAGDLDGVHYRGRERGAGAGWQQHRSRDSSTVLSYEQQNGWFSASAWLRKLLMVSSNWGGRSGYGPANPLTAIIT